MKYKLIVDNGKPYEKDFKNKDDLFKELLFLKCSCENFAYCDIEIIRNTENVTNEVFKEFDKSQQAHKKPIRTTDIMTAKNKIQRDNIRKCFK